MPTPLGKTVAGAALAACAASCRQLGEILTLNNYMSPAMVRAYRDLATALEKILAELKATQSSPPSNVSPIKSRLH